MKLSYPEGATPLEPDYIKQLVPTHISNQKQLNEWEAANIQEAYKWVFFKRREKNTIDIGFVKKLHKKMFDKTWVWAGEFRKIQTNIGVEPYRILLELASVLEDIKFYKENNTYSLIEIALRLHHRIVLVHPFPNGNGRLARLMADIFLFDAGQGAFEWGEETPHMRKNYIEALKAADKYDYVPLLKFVRKGF